MPPKPHIALDELRLQALAGVCSKEKFKALWDAYYRPEAQKHLLAGGKPGSATGEKVWRLGEHLREVFKSNPATRAGSVGGEGQAMLATAGSAFESLLVWYLNLLLWGSEAIVNGKVKDQLSTIPDTLRKITTVRMGNYTSNSETDLLAYSVPASAMAVPHGGFGRKEADELIRANLHETEVSILQAKTNWRDNAQIPMLWNWVYEDPNPVSGAYVVGVDGFSPLGLKRFTYGFVTVPTGGEDAVGKDAKPHHIHVRRVSRLGGGNYWLHATKDGVANCINQFPGSNLRYAIARTDAGHLRGHVEQMVDSYPGLVDAFLDLDF
jgi:hypothetical protein